MSKKILSLLLLSSSSEENNFIYCTDWSDNIDNFSDLQFHENFRFSREQMEILYRYLCGRSYKKKSLKRDLYVYVYHCTHIETYRETREMFGLPKSSVNDLVERFSYFLYSIAVEEITLPEPNEFDSLKTVYTRYGLHNDVILAIDGTHFPIRRPKLNGSDYYNRKGFYSLNFILLVDGNMCFRGYTHGHGSSHDFRLLNISGMGRYIENLPENVRVVGDPAFRSFQNIIVPENLTENSSIAEKSLKTQRVLVENTFGLFKGKFRRFSRPIQNGESLKNRKILISCFWLHNFFIKNN